LSAPIDQLREAVDHAAHLLPTQGPIGVFIHHNTLHAFEHLPFEQAVVAAARIFDAEPYLTADAFRHELGRGRIRSEDIDAVLAELSLHGGPRRPSPDGAEPHGAPHPHGRESLLGSDDAPMLGGRTTRRALRRLLLVHPLRDGNATAIRWRLGEEGLGVHLLPEVSLSSRASIVGEAIAWLGSLPRTGDALPTAFADALHPGEGATRVASWIDATPNPDALDGAVHRRPEACAVAALWSAVTRRIADAAPIPAEIHARAPRVDDEDVRTVLIPLLSSYLDRGVAYWPMPGRQRGFYEAVRTLVVEGPSIPMRLLAAARTVLAEQARLGLDAEHALLHSLEAMGHAPHTWSDVLTASALALPGWAGMMRTLETQPELAPHGAPPCRLVDYFAVRLLLDRLAAAAPSIDVSAPGDDARVREAFAVFQVAQWVGVSAPALLDLSSAEIEELRQELRTFDDFARRHAFHLAYERRHRLDVLQALAIHRRQVEVRRERLAVPSLQVMFCIDEREEAIRRHVEEIDPEVETLGTGGFFAVAMSFRGIDDAHHAALCPVVVRPQHEIRETSHDPTALARYHGRRRLWAELSHGAFFGTRSLVRAWIGTFGLGLLSMMPLTLRILFPRAITRLSKRLERALFPRPATMLPLHREADERGSQGLFVGFTLPEMADRVERLLHDVGLVRRFAPIVAVVGHGSSSLNNPHESAHDCGACGGGHGAANARTFALMANDRSVRAALRERGLAIPDDTVFVGAFHDTCNDSLVLFDTDRVPPTHREHLARLRHVLDEARTLSAHERCRRFESVPLDATPEAALRHVEGRAEDLAEPRPEYGHCTNAVCVFGRRTLTRGLFLDRRAFLVSYDPTIDPDAVILGRLLAAMGPVGAGISLEYYFSVVDNERYGCGTKLPHNVTGLIGVMNGHMSDLRTGLPWQMVEIHEPVRLLVVVEATPAMIAKVVERHPEIGKLVADGWIQLALVDPQTGVVTEYAHGEFRPVPAPSHPLPSAPRSIDWYRGRREHLPIATIDAVHRVLDRAS
jgi:uncharacterized protein YbcC (UPF0753/DUF2309 family)